MRIHQIWIGAEMPPADRADAEKMRAACAVSGVPHRYEFSDTWSGTASYGIEAESRSTSHTLNIGVSKSF